MSAVQPSDARARVILAAGVSAAERADPASAADFPHADIGTPAATPRGPIRVPPLAALILCMSSALIGVAIDHRVFQPQTPAPRIALAEQGAVVLEALLNRPDLDPAMARLAVGQTVARVVSRYQQLGFLVINANRGAEGQLLVESVPSSSIDITDEMRAAVAQAIAANAPANRTAPIAAPSSPGVARFQAN